LFLAALLPACSGADEGQLANERLELPFEVFFDDQPFGCDVELDNLGVGKTSVVPLDFRMFVHDVELVREDGAREPFLLEDDGVWQRDGLALLDFEDGTGSCSTGSPDVNRSLRGRASARNDYVQVSFTVGLPESKNHLDAATAPAPLNAPGMWWSWQGGYKYMKVDVASEANPGGYFFHLGGTNCEGSPALGYSCQYANLPRVEVELSASGGVILNAEALYSGVDLSTQPDMQTDFIAGCMAFSGDPECPAMFAALGLSFEEEPMPSGAPQMLDAHSGRQH
jgi:uncharacterized repeat protein (TIGR04052 family)